VGHDPEDGVISAGTRIGGCMVHVSAEVGGGGSRIMETSDPPQNVRHVYWCRGRDQGSQSRKRDAMKLRILM